MIRNVRHPPSERTFGSADQELDWRLMQIPETASCRGFYVNGLEKVATSLGPNVLETYRERFPITRVPNMRMHPVSDYLRRAHTIVVSHYGEQGLQQGRSFVQGFAAEAFRTSVLGRYLVQFVGGNIDRLFRLLRWMNDNRHLIVNYGSWHFEKMSDEMLRGTFVDEYIYIESSMAGALDALARAWGLSAEVDVSLDSPFRGTVEIHIRKEGAQARLV